MTSNKLLPLIALVGIACLGLGIYSFYRTTDAPASRAVNASSGSELFMLPANRPGWQSVGSGSFILEIRGTVDYGGETATPDSSQRAGDGTCLVSDAPIGSVVGKIGESGKPFKVGSLYKFNTTETVYIAVNDSDYRDNSGSYTVTKTYK